MNDTIRAALITFIKSNRQRMSRAERRRGISPQRWLYPWATENRYAVTIRAWLRPMKDYVHSYLKENQEYILRGDSADFHVDGVLALRLDAVPGKSFKTMVNSLTGWLGKYVPIDDEGKSGSPIYMGLGNIAESVFAFNEGQFEKGAKTVLGVEFPVGEDWWPDAKQYWSDENYKHVWKTLNDYKDKVSAMTEQAVTSGWTVKTLAEQIHTLDTKMTTSRANFIARDQIGKLNGEITHRRMESVGLTMYIWETSGDERVRSSHGMMDGGLCRWDDSAVYSQDGGKTWINRPSGAILQHPGMDYQCFPGSTKINSFFDNERIYQRTYHGEMTTLITSKGKIDCTSNHPILTDKGWRSAKLINIGDRIVKVKRECILTGGTNPQNSITTFDELFSFFNVFLDAERIRLGDEDFHGDISVDQKVNVITPKSVLRNYVKADIDEAFFQKVFAEADAATLGERQFVSDIFRDCFSFRCGMSFFGKAHFFLSAGMRHSDNHTLRAIAWVQSILNKTTVDGSPSCAELFGNSLDTQTRLEQFAYFLFWELFSVMRWVIVMNRGISPSPHSNVKIATKDAFELGNLTDIHSSDIELDTIVDKVIIPDYEGHIYNLQNTNGWYTVSPEHYIVKNCRCTAIAYWQELVGEADAMIAQYEELDALAAQNIAAMPKSMASKPLVKPKKEYLTKNKIEQNIAAVIGQMEKLSSKYGGDVFGKGTVADKQLYTDLEAKQAEYQQLLDKKLLAEQKKLLIEQQTALQKEFDNLQVKTYSGIWKDDVTTADYEAKATGIQAKKEYFQNKLKSGGLSITEKEKLEQYLEALKEFEAEGKHYAHVQKELQKAQSNLTQLKKYGIIKADDVFSQERKDAALWAKSPKEYDDAIRPQCGEIWRGATKEEREAIYAYTQGSGGFNRPLRGYDGNWDNFKGIGKVDLDTEGRGVAIKNMTKLINKSQYDRDIWLQRGIGTVKGTAGFLQISEDELMNSSQAQLQKLVGREIPDEGFVSCGSSKGKGFNGYIFNVYCPKGTKMMYAEPFSRYGDGAKLHWDDRFAKLDGISKQSDFGYEDETIIQRRTTFRVTKVEKKSENVFFDIEVVKQIGD